MILSIPDMNCGHCKASVEAALAPLAAGIAVDLPARQVTIHGAPNPAALISALAAVGFPAQVLAE
jgi:copper chaperone